MKDYRLTLNEYVDYLTQLQKNIFAILPLYEERNEFITECVDDVVSELIYVKNIINELPHAYWYVKAGSNLEELLVEVGKDNHKKVRKKVLHTTNLIQKEIDNISKIER